ncbi:uncharacterized protein LOC143350198 [Colletes latitarsis]|uniref:uncharacterized protein LOC143350198 n=1 Tax=Colletes latitarsis TaxID=2605962 RepID=UPI004035B70D
MHIKILQINLNGCRLAQDLMLKTAEDLNVDAVVVSEPYTVMSSWVGDVSRKAAIWSTGFNGLRVLNDRTVVGRGFAAVSLGGVQLCSCYYTPRYSAEELAEELAELERARQLWGQDVIVAGDFNSKSPAWGSRRLDDKGIALTAAFDRMGVIPVVPRGRCTFERNGRSSVIDVLAGNQALVRKMTRSRILDALTESDHFYILHEYRDDGRAAVGGMEGVMGWRADTLDGETYLEAFRRSTVHINATLPLSARVQRR